MTPAEAALEVAKSLDDRQSWNYDIIEVRALDIAAQAFRDFAELLSAPSESIEDDSSRGGSAPLSARVPEGGPGAG